LIAGHMLPETRTQAFVEAVHAFLSGSHAL